MHHNNRASTNTKKTERAGSSSRRECSFFLKCTKTSFIIEVFFLRRQSTAARVCVYCGYYHADGPESFHVFCFTLISPFETFIRMVDDNGSEKQPEESHYLCKSQRRGETKKNTHQSLSYLMYREQYEIRVHRRSLHSDTSLMTAY